MTAAWWILFHRSPLRWTTPLGASICMLLVNANLGGRPITSIQASSEAALAVVVWAPAVLLISYASSLATGLTRGEDVLVLPTMLGSRLRRVVSVVATQILWITLGWIGLWVGCSYLPGRDATPFYSIMALNGIAVSMITTLAGAALAAYRVPAWVAAIISGAAYAGLVIWSYIPDVAASVLYSPYGPLALTDALPNPRFLALQLAWAITATLLFTAWSARLVTSAVAFVWLVLVAVLVTMTRMPMTEVLPRSGHLALSCHPHARVDVCLWADHEATRSRINAEVDRARRLAGRQRLADTVSEGDLDVRVPRALPAQLRSSVAIIRVSADPVPRAGAARLIADSIRVRSGCPAHTTVTQLALPIDYVAERIVAERQVPDGRMLTDAQIPSWLSRVFSAVADCRTPPAP